MRWPFRRQPRGRHALGAAISGVPVAPAPSTPSPFDASWGQLRPATASARVAPPAPDSVQTPVEPPAAPTGPRVELGFADGSVRTLDPASADAQALGDLVQQLRSTR